jgi:hypothetical protein
MAQRLPIARQHGQGLVEYVIVLVGISLAALLVLVNFGGRIQALFVGADGEVDDLAADVLAELDSDGGLSRGALLGGSLDGNSGDSGARQPTARARASSSAGSPVHSSSTADARSGRSGAPSELTDAERWSAFEDPAGPVAAGSDEPAINLLVSGIVCLLALGLAVVLRLGLAGDKES